MIVAGKGRAPRTSQARFHHSAARPAHADERDKRCEHFVAAFTDLIDPRVAHHSFQLGAVTRERRFLSLAIQFRQYVIFAVRYPLYEMATDMLMQALHV
jgi:hypothetical protein